MSAVRCKMVVANKSDTWNSHSKSQDCSVVELVPVSGPENKTWSQWTPGGSIKLHINNPVAFEAFKLGGTYFVDFTPAPATEAEEPPK
jgi:hypothetical protein